jgi:acetyl-CoA carboxylase carboxyl transferase subunit beta
MALGAHARISMLADSGSFEEFDAALASSDPLGFSAAKPYTESLQTARSTSELNEAVALGRAAIGGHPVVVGSMDGAVEPGRRRRDSVAAGSTTGTS